jgi:hypothetical protein
MSAGIKTGSAERQAPADNRFLKAAIIEETGAACSRAYSGPLRALVLTGSLAREEATFVSSDAGWKSRGDAEFFLVFDERANLPAAGEMNELSEKISARLRERKIRCAIGLDAVHPRYFARLRPHIFAYELRTCGQVIWGDTKVLSLIPNFPASAIPLEDAWRLLANRLIEQLEVAPLPAAGRAFDLSDWLYRTAKLYLDMATSLLVFLGHYEPTYRGRLERLRSLASQLPQKNGVPFPLDDFAERVALCTHFKIEGGEAANGFLAPHALEDTARASKEALSYAQRLWRWELARLTRLQGQVPDSQLLRTWMRLQPLSDRLRGWLFVLRTCGWQKSWREWPHWMWAARHASPRYCVYAVASELLFEDADPVAAGSAEAGSGDFLKDLRRQLPVPPEQETAPGDRQAIVASVIWSYHRFLEKTRS